MRAKQQQKLIQLSDLAARRIICAKKPRINEKLPESIILEADFLIAAAAAAERVRRLVLTSRIYYRSDIFIPPLLVHFYVSMPIFYESTTCNTTAFMSPSSLSLVSYYYRSRIDNKKRDQEEEAAANFLLKYP